MVYFLFIFDKCVHVNNKLKKKLKILFQKGFDNRKIIGINNHKTKDDDKINQERLYE